MDPPEKIPSTTDDHSTLNARADHETTAAETPSTTETDSTRLPSQPDPTPVPNDADELVPVGGPSSEETGKPMDVEKPHVGEGDASTGGHAGEETEHDAPAAAVEDARPATAAEDILMEEAAAPRDEHAVVVPTQPEPEASGPLPPSPAPPAVPDSLASFIPYRESTPQPDSSNLTEPRPPTPSPPTPSTATKVAVPPARNSSVTPKLNRALLSNNAAPEPDSGIDEGEESPDPLDMLPPSSAASVVSNEDDSNARPVVSGKKVVKKYGKAPSGEGKMKKGKGKVGSSTDVQETVKKVPHVVVPRRSSIESSSVGTLAKNSTNFLDEVKEGSEAIVTVKRKPKAVNGKAKVLPLVEVEITPSRRSSLEKHPDASGSSRKSSQQIAPLAAPSSSTLPPTQSQTQRDPPVDPTPPTSTAVPAALAPVQTQQSHDGSSSDLSELKSSPDPQPSLPAKRLPVDSGSDSPASAAESPKKKRKPAATKTKSKAKVQNSVANGNSDSGTDDDEMPAAASRGSNKVKKSTVKKLLAPKSKASALKSSQGAGTTSLASPKRGRKVASGKGKGKGKGGDSSEEEEDDVNTSPAKKRVVGKLEASGKGKGKTVTVVAPSTKTTALSSTALSSKLSGLKLPPSSQSSILKEHIPASQTSTSALLNSLNRKYAPRETPQDREVNWSLGVMDSPIWVRVTAGETSFWWPGEFGLGQLRSERPLSIRLLVDNKKEIEQFSPINISLDVPSSESIVSFRSSAHGRTIRFSPETYLCDPPSLPLDGGDPTPPTAPSANAFSDALDQAYAMEQDDGDESDTAVLPVEEEDDSEEDVLAALNVLSEHDSEDELLREVPEHEKLVFPIRALVKSTRAWWPATITGYELPSDGQKAPVKYNVEFTDGTVRKVVRGHFLTDQEPEFYKVPMGETTLAVAKDFKKRLAAFVHESFPTLLEIINDSYRFTKDWNAGFFAGGSKRMALAQKARFGDLGEDHQDVLSGELVDWLLPKDPSLRPIGCPAFESLDDLNRTQYTANILVPLIIRLHAISTNDFRTTALKVLTGEGNAEPTKDEIEMRAHGMVDEDFDRGSVDKFIRAARGAQKAAEENPLEMAKTKEKLNARMGR